MAKKSGKIKKARNLAPGKKLERTNTLSGKRMHKPFSITV